MKKKLFVGSAGAYHDGYLYFCPKEHNTFCRADLENGNVEVLAFFKETSTDLYRKAYVYEDKIWFIPWKSKYIVKVNLDTLIFTYYEIPFRVKSDIGENIEKCAYLSSGTFKDRYIFLVPTMYDTPLIIDMKTDIIIPFFDALSVDNQAYGYGCVTDDYFWLSPHTGKILVKLDISDGKVEKLGWRYNTLAYRGMSYYDGKIWFSPGTDSSDILFFDPIVNEFGKLSVHDSKEELSSYNESFVCDGELVILPYIGNRILRVNNSNGSYDVLTNEIKETIGLRVLGNSEKKILASENDNHVYEWKDNKLEDLCELEFSDYGKTQLLRHIIEIKSLSFEGDYSLKHFLGAV
jgi:hypothetical protein